MGFDVDANRFKALITTLGTQKEVLRTAIDGGAISSAKQKEALDSVDQAIKDLKALMAKTKVPDQERIRRKAELQAEIDRIELLRDFEPDFDKRMELVRRLTRLSAILGTWESIDIFRFDTLLDVEGHDFRTVLEEANKDINSRQNLQRVLKGIEVALVVAAFGATLAAKLAATVA